MRRLFEAIHRVNPTPRALPAAAEPRRYMVKARLQSLLLCRFESEVRVQAEPPGAVVLLVARHLMLAAMLRQADARLKAGDPEGARGALDVPETCDDGEVQAPARLARAHLSVEPDRADLRLRKTAALAAFVEVMGGEDGAGPHELLLPEAWGAEELDRIDREARAWLDS